MASCTNTRYCAQFLCVLSTSPPKTTVAVSEGHAWRFRYAMSHQCDLGNEWRKSAVRRPYMPKAPGDYCQSSARSQVLFRTASCSDLGLFVSQLVASSLKSIRAKKMGRFRRATWKSLIHSANRTYSSSSTRWHQKFAPFLLMGTGRPS